MSQRPASATQAIREARLLAILRGRDMGRLADIAEVLVSEGIHALEFPVARPEVLPVITKIADRLGSTGWVGAGTVRNVRDAQRAIDAGAGFLVAPSLSIPVMQYARESGIDFVPGVFTPSEIDAATQAGADIVKLFPASSHGPGFLRQILPPLPDAGIMPTGTITRTDATYWLDAGAVALGVGSDLIGEATQTGDYQSARTAAREWRRIVAEQADNTCDGSRH